MILHTRTSLTCILEAAGFKSVHINGVQRYPLSNHLNWLANGKPGGHRSSLSLIDNFELKEIYAKTLNGLDATDTLVAVAECT